MLRCVIDEGRPFEAAFQEEASNYPPLLLPKGSGRERKGKRPRQVLGQVTFEKRNARGQRKTVLYSRQEVLEAYKKVRGRARRNLDQGYSVASRILFRHE